MARLELRNPFETRIRVFDPEEVTSRDGHPEVDPREVDLRRRDVDAIWRGVVDLYRTGLYPAIGLCLRRRGRVVIDRAIGHARGNAPGDPRSADKVPATPATLHNLFSASKMVTAMLIHLLDQRRLIHLDDPVADYLPEFGQNGKDWITLRHVLTHRSGIPTLPGKHADLGLLADPEQLLAILCEARPVLRPGRRLAYHALTGGFVLGAVIERVTGVDVRTFLDREIRRPLGLDHFNYGVAEADLDQVAENAFTGPPLMPPVSTLLRRALGVDLPHAVVASNDPRFQTAVVPAGNLITTAWEATRFLELLLQGGELDGVRIFDPRTIRRAVAEQSYLELDLTLGIPVRYGMGFMLGSDHVSGYGWRTAHGFGHMGLTNVVLFADPERDISLCLMTSGKPFIAPGVLRYLLLMQEIAWRCPRDWGR